MKTLMLRVCYLGLAVSTILASPGTEEPAKVETTDPVADVLEPLKILDADALAESEVPSPLALAAAGDTNAPPRTNPPVKPIPVQEPVAPANVQLSPAMAEVVKLIQAGVTPDVLMAYITNSTAVFNINSDVIVYLNDLGVTNSVITALIQHDSSPDAAARKASAAAAQPLPPGVSAAAPVTNVYPPAARASLPAAGQTSYPGEFSNVADTNVPVEAATEEPPTVTAPLATGENVTVNHFYSSLAPYGSWVDVPGYGLCWRPTVAVVNPYWRPYADNGRWLWSDAGWYWYSDYSWGWAPFHYGRWCSYPSYGWVWVPGSVWAPSWVTWRYYDGYCGWAPLPPGCGYRAGYGLTWYGSGVAVGFGWGLGAHCYTYVPTYRFCDWNVSRHCLPSHGIHAVHRNSVNVNRIHTRNNAIVNEGIDPNTIAKVSRSRIPTAKIKDQALPADARVKPERLDARGDNVAIVRPQLPKVQPGAKPAPSVVRGTGTTARPASLANSSQTTAGTPPSTVTRPTQTPTATTVAAPRQNVKNSGAVRDTGTTKGPDSVAATPAPNAAAQPHSVNPSSTRPATPNRPTVTPPANRPQQAANPATPNVQRQTAPTAAPGAIARNNITPRQNSAPVGRSVTPPAAQPARPAAQPARPAPQQAAPTRSVSPMIRSYAQPQASVPSAAVPRSVQPSYRSNPMAAPSARPQVSTPSFQAPRQSYSPPAVRSAPSAPAVRSAPAPSVSRSAPSGGNSGGSGGGRSSGGGAAYGAGAGRGGPR